MLWSRFWRAVARLATELVLHTPRGQLEELGWEAKVESKNL